MSQIAPEWQAKRRSVLIVSAAPAPSTGSKIDLSGEARAQQNKAIRHRIAPYVLVAVLCAYIKATHLHGNFLSLYLNRQATSWRPSHRAHAVALR